MDFPDLMTQWSLVDKELHGFDFYRSVPSFRKTSVFLVGESIDASSDRIKEIAEDIQDEMSEFVPFPFDDVTLALKCDDSSWISWRILSVIPKDMKEFFSNSIFSSLTSGQLEEQKLAKQLFFVVSGNFRDGGRPLTLPYFLNYMGIKDDGSLFTRAHYPPAWAREVFENFNEREYMNLIRSENKLTGFILRLITAISHPSNYTLRVDPKLSDKEEKNVRKFGNVPAHKKPYFITIDHDVLVSMRDGKKDDAEGELEDDRKSPAPHHRRGHWKRLAERCRQARLLGREKVWVRPTFVGDRAFSDETNKYEVLMNFGSQVAR